MAQSSFRRASAADLEGTTETIWQAFASDPLWSWAFPENETRRAWWKLLVGAALAHEFVWTALDHAAVAVWIPPGREELSPAQEREAHDLIRRLAGTRAPEVDELLELFGAAHPSEPHYYLSLLGTHPAHRGLGVGTALLEATLRTIDGEGAPCYLESSNPVNVPRYEAMGFVQHGSFARPDGGLDVTTMWRAGTQ